MLVSISKSRTQAITRAMHGLLLGLALIPPQASADLKPELMAFLLETRLAFEPPQKLSIHEVIMWVVNIRSSQPPAEVAELLSRSAPFEQVLTLPGQLWLSGLAGGQHWLALLGSQGAGTQGQISILKLNTHADASAAPGCHDLGLISQAMPARLLVNQRVQKARHKWLVCGWRVAWPPDRLVPALENSLFQQAGQRLQLSATPSGIISAWQVGGHRMDIFSAPQGHHTWLFVQVSGLSRY